MPNRRPRVDSQIRRVQFLFDNIRMGFGFLEVAREQADTTHRAAMRGYARLACRTTVRLMRFTTLSHKDRQRLLKQLKQLGAAIDATR